MPTPGVPSLALAPSLTSAVGDGAGLATTAQLTVSVFAAAEPIGKIRGIDATGALRKQTSTPRLDAVSQRTFDSLREFARYALRAPANEALAFGVCDLAHARVAVADADRREDVVARTKEFFSFGGRPGILLLDYDPLPGEEPLAPRRLVDILRQAVPELRLAAMAAKPSTSAFLFSPNGAELVGPAGVHIFVAVEDSRRIPALGATIADKLWLAGHGRIKITGNGNRIRATLIDTSVWSPERLCFTRADCRDGVEHRFPPLEYFPGEFDDLAGEGWLADITPLSENEIARLELLQRRALDAAEPEAREARERWAEQQLDKRLQLAGKRGEEIDQEAVRASLLSGEHVLPADLVLHPVGREPITAGEMFKDGAAWDGARLADPFEPSYGDDPRIALAVFNCDEPHIFSHAHGGQRYLFRSESDRAAELLADFQDLGPAPEIERKRRKFEATPAGEFIKGKAPAWLIKGVLPEAALGVVYGASGSGKTFFVLDLVAAVALGEPWRDRRVKQRTVAYICAEGVAGFRTRVQAYLRQRDVDFGSQLLVISQPPNLLAEGDAKALGEEIARAGAGVVVVDTFAQVTPGADENSAIDVGKALKACRDIHAATGALVLLVHHSGKDASRGARGWSGMRAAADAEIEVSKAETGHTATISKMKDGEDGCSFGFRLLPILLGHDDDGDEISSCVVSPCEVSPDVAPPKHGANQRAVLQALLNLMPLSGDGVSTEAVLSAAVEALPFEQGSGRDRRREYASRAFQQLVGRGEIIEADGVARVPSQSSKHEKEESEQ